MSAKMSTVPQPGAMDDDAARCIDMGIGLADSCALAFAAGLASCQDAALRLLFVRTAMTAFAGMVEYGVGFEASREICADIACMGPVGTARPPH